MIFKWFTINVHLVPSFVAFVLGLFLLFIAPIMYQIRKKKLFIINPVRVIRGYAQSEKKVFIIGIISLAIGLVSAIVIAKIYGYYYLKNGIPTLLIR